MKDKTNYRIALATAVLMAFGTGCASIVHGTRQNIPVSSDPAGASVYVDGELRGATPLTLQVRRGDSTTEVKVELEGYRPVQQTLNRKFSWWYTGNVFFGGLIGFAVDAVNGAMWYQNCDEINVILASDVLSGPRIAPVADPVPDANPPSQKPNDLLSTILDDGK